MSTANGAQGGVERFRKHLERMEQKLAAELKRLEEAPHFGSDVDGLEEEAEETEATGVSLGIRETVRKRVELVREALRKLEEGRYGICERCGEKIDEKLLLIDPESELCRRCKVR